MKILAIESTHDDTSIALYKNGNIIEEKTISQTSFHKKFGGTLPEFAARIHSENSIKILSYFKSKYDLSQIDHIAYTKEPGLIGGRNVARTFAYGVGFALNKPVRPINHMHGHIFAAAFDNDITYPAIALIVSGGHSQLWYLTSPFPDDIKILGQTKDDAVGEVYDKVARKLEIGFPGGPAIDKLSLQGHSTIDFSISIDKSYDFSFSGLKTKVLNYINNEKQKNNKLNIPDICASFQDAILKPLLVKTSNAIKEFQPMSLILGGGVSANAQLRKKILNLHENTLIPSMKYTTDNASMIAITSHLQLKKNILK